MHSYQNGRQCINWERDCQVGHEILSQGVGHCVFVKPPYLVRTVLHSSVFKHVPFVDNTARGSGGYMDALLEIAELGALLRTAVECLEIT